MPPSDCDPAATPPPSASVLGAGGAADAPRLNAIAQSADDISIDFIAGLGIPDGGTILDVGCGTAELAARMAAQIVPNCRVIAVDKDTTAAAAAHGHDPRVQITAGDITVWQPEPDQSFDLIHARFVLSHVQERDDPLARMLTWLPPGGHLIITEPVALPVNPVAPRAVRKVFRAYHQWASSQGMSLTFGAAVPGLAAAQQANLDIAVHTRPTRCGGGPGVDRWASLIAPIGQHLTPYGITPDILDDFLRAAAAPDTFEIPQIVDGS